MNNDVKVVRIRHTATLPTKAHPGDAGWDLYSDNEEEITIEPMQRVLIPTGIKLSIPEGYYGRIADRSGNSWKGGIHVLGGVIDSHYRGEVKVILANLNPCAYPESYTESYWPNSPPSIHESDFVIHRGNKIAQIVITKIHTDNLVEVDELDQTDRGNKGFGSSGN